MRDNRWNDEHELVLQFGVPPFDRLAQRDAFQLGLVPGQDRQILPVQWGHAEAAQVIALDQALRRQSTERLAQGTGADVVSLAHGLDAQFAARLEIAMRDVRAQSLVDGAGARRQRDAARGDTNKCSFSGHWRMLIDYQERSRVAFANDVLTTGKAIAFVRTTRQTQTTDLCVARRATLGATVVQSRSLAPRTYC